MLQADNQTTLYSELTIPRYAMNQVTVMSNMFLGGNCSVRRKDDPLAEGLTGTGGNLVIFNFLFIFNILLHF